MVLSLCIVMVCCGMIAAKQEQSNSLAILTGIVAWMPAIINIIIQG